MLIRVCPGCKSERSVAEVSCEAEVNGVVCGWDLLGVDIQESGAERAGAPGAVGGDAAAPDGITPGQRVCVNGHPMEAGDFLCAVCESPSAMPAPRQGAAPSPESSQGRAPGAGALEPAVIEGWRLGERLSTSAAGIECFAATRVTDGRAGILTRYTAVSPPDPAVYEALRRLPRAHVPELLAAGRREECAYDVMEEVSGGDLSGLSGMAGAGGDPLSLRPVIEQLGRALDELAACGLRHRDLRPSHIRIRSREPLDLVITGFAQARMSEFELDVAPATASRYSAPEMLAGAVAAASDWWSLGMVLLELVTGGACFAGVNEQAFLIRVVTEGVSRPEGLGGIASPLDTLLRGLLARDRRARWQWKEVQGWLAGDPVEPPAWPGAAAEEVAGAGIELGGKTHRTAAAFALAAADAAHWEEARNALLRGAVASWAQESGFDPMRAAALREIVRDVEVPEDWQLALALKVINPAMPLIFRGHIVAPRWLLDNPGPGYELICGPAANFLRKTEEEWLVQLHARAAAVRAQATRLEIDLNVEDLRILLLTTSPSRLAALWEQRRALFPDSEHAALAGLMNRKPGEEDLIVLLAASIGQFRSLPEVVEAAAAEASQAKVGSFDEAVARQWLLRSRREIYRSIDERIARFARCGIEKADEWADGFRLDRRLPLTRALVLLAVPQARWRPLPGQAYLSALLEFFSRRINTSALRGSLARMRIGSRAIDLMELGTGRMPASNILAELLARSSKVNVDPAPLAEGALAGRVRQLQSRTLIYRRETGIEGLYLGFPFLLVRSSGSSAPRIAPVLLWPVRILLEVGNRTHLTLAFGRERSDSDQVILNPAFEGLMGTPELQRWQEVADDLMTREVSMAAVLDAFGTLAPLRGSKLASLPRADAEAQLGRPELVPAAVLFHMTFMGQAMVKDLEVLRGRSPAGTGLETALRLNDDKERPAVGPAREANRYFTASSDPSQEEAVMEARRAPGLVIEGPPGTGKSQTIVNMVADAIARGKSLLVICQKQAALEVVYKRLEREQLGDRIMMLTDAEADREMVIKAIRQQVETFYSQPATPGGTPAWRRERDALAARIEALEGEIDNHQAVLHRVDERIGLSYRMLISELIESAGSPKVSAPGLRVQLLGRHPLEVAAIADACAGISSFWLKARVEGSALKVLRTFSPDTGSLELFRSALSGFLAAEETRWRVIQETPGAAAILGTAQTRAWLGRHERGLRALSPQERQDILNSYKFLRGPEGQGVAAALVESRAGLAALDVDQDAVEAPVICRLRSLDQDVLQQASQLVTAATLPARGLAKLSIGRWLARRRLTRFIAGLGFPGRKLAIEDFAAGVALECCFRRLRKPVAAAAERLREALPADAGDAAAHARLAGHLHARLLTVQQVLTSSEECVDVARALDEAHADRHADPVAGWLARLECSLRRGDARTASIARLEELTASFEPAWIESRRRAVDSEASNEEALRAVQAALPILQAYQEFRVRAVQLGQTELAALAVLRPQEAALAQLSPADLEDCVRRTILTEARMAWKIRIESESPAVFMECDALARKVETLAKADQAMRGLNRQLLCSGVDRSRVRPKGEWEEVTRLKGQRKLRLREFIDRSMDLGLLALRPVWLMTPDVASRVLQPTAGLFDTVIYDEASQMPVEYALPTLFRAKVVIISGDEKQMPPSSFFSSRLEGDESEIYEGEDPDDETSEEERADQVNAWNRRDIQDCPDLLHLGRECLPVRTLQVHYRSQYRELIAFSNAAFYGNRLSVPVRHPVEVIRESQPIEVIATGGQYSEQVNRDEAEAVVAYLAKLWRRAEPPSIGVATFNRKQADLIEEVIEQKAESSPTFRNRLLRERDRMEEGADMGFFVKNVENIQGDERDVILFSTTFGPNAQGKFRRNFGVLGQTGGERRLNVAVSRARVKVVLVTSMPVAEISDMLSEQRAPKTPRDYLQAYMQYAHLMSAGKLDAARKLLERVMTETPPAGFGGGGERDGFIDAVAEFFRKEGWQAADARDGGAFGLDFAIVDPSTGLYSIGIECDAPRHAILGAARAREVWRPSVLRRAVPHIHRVSSLAWLNAREAEQARLRAAVLRALSAVKEAS